MYNVVFVEAVRGADSVLWHFYDAVVAGVKFDCNILEGVLVFLSTACTLQMQTEVAD